MKPLRFLIYGVVLGLLLPLTFANSGVADMTKLDMLHSVAFVGVHTEDPQKGGVGSGVVFFSDKEQGFSLILTAAHVVDMPHVTEIFVALAPSGLLIPATVIKVGVLHDLAILRVNVAHDKVAIVGRTVYTSPTTDVYKGGVGGLLVPFLTSGMVAANVSEYIAVSTPVTRGDSGGGIFTKVGDEYHLIGIILNLRQVQISRDVIIPVNHAVTGYNIFGIQAFLKQ